MDIGTSQICPMAEMAAILQNEKCLQITSVDNVCISETGF